MKQNTILAIAIASLLTVSCQEKSSETVTDASTSSGETYPLEVCVVSGEQLGSMGEPVVYDHEGTTVKFCCKACIKDFKENPAPYLAKLQQPPTQ